MTHHQPKTAKKGQFSTTDVYASTVAHLTLPCDNIHHEFDRAYDEMAGDAGGMPFLATQSGDSTPVAIPSELSKADSLRFSRAIKILGFRPENSNDAKTAVSDLAKDKEVIEERENKVAAESTTERDWAPKLRMLYSQAVDDAW